MAEQKVEAKAVEAKKEEVKVAKPITLGEMNAVARKNFAGVRKEQAKNK